MKQKRKRILDEDEENRKLRRAKPIREIDLGNGMSTAGYMIKQQLKQAMYFKRPEF